MLFGNKCSFAIDFLGQESGLEIADIYIAGQNVTKIDNAHYKFVSTLKVSAEDTNRTDELLKSDNLLPGDTLEQRYNQILDHEIRFNFQVLDWGPPTDDIFAIIIPFKGDIYLCALLYNEGKTISVKIDGSMLSATMLAAAEHIKNQINGTQQNRAPF
ncbi:hypothetical protein [Alteromonas sp. AMM-1]|uniref:hypothetical protein n=1 Tax=Alteromonas sp. AMM-1 TaxID=3394233 RepID=UPI0039A69B69